MFAPAQGSELWRIPGFRATILAVADPGASRGARADGAFALGYRPQLDGLRAVAVLAVMTFHAAILADHNNPLPGGFLGVDLFFALSGFLITTILAEEWLRRGRIDVPAFYVRRALRLLPAVVLLLGAVTADSVLVVRTTSAAQFVRGQVLWTALYFQNWHLIETRPHFPSDLSHMWSLSVEEQFYLLWPLLLLLVLVLRASPRVTIGIVVAGAAASAVAMGLLSGTDPMHYHAYYGTDTRAQTLLLGAALGLAAVFGKLPAPRRRWPSVAGWAGAAFFVVAFATYDERGAFTTQGGLTLAAVAAVALILGVVCAPQTLLARALAARGPLESDGSPTACTSGTCPCTWPSHGARAPSRSGTRD